MGKCKHIFDGCISEPITNENATIELSFYKKTIDEKTNFSLTGKTRWGHMYVEVLINFCPICGKRLNDG